MCCLLVGWRMHINWVLIGGLSGENALLEWSHTLVHLHRTPTPSLPEDSALSQAVGQPVLFFHVLCLQEGHYTEGRVVFAVTCIFSSALKSYPSVEDCCTGRPTMAFFEKRRKGLYITRCTCSVFLVLSACAPGCVCRRRKVNCPR